MADPKIEAAAAIARAQASLEQAVLELEKLPALDGRSIALSAHALNNFLTVSVVVVDLLLEALRDYPNRQVLAWLEGLSHSSDLMTHTVSQLMCNSTGAEIDLRWEVIELPRLVEKACAYYRRHAAQKRIELHFSAAGDVPIIRTDRVVVAVVLDNLLSNAVKYSPAGKRMWVRVHPERGGVRCGVRDEGPGLSSEEHPPVSSGRPPRARALRRRALQRLRTRDRETLRGSTGWRNPVREHPGAGRDLLVLAASRRKRAALGSGKKPSGGRDPDLNQ